MEHNACGAKTKVTTQTRLEDEPVLVEQARQGSAEAYVKLMEHYERRIYRLALSILANHHDAEDVLQEVCLKAFTHLSDFRGESLFYTWIARIATNECLMKLRRGRGLQPFSLDEALEGDDGSPLPREIEDWRDTPEKTYLKVELQAIIAECMDKLDRTSRLVFLLRDIEQFSTEETAQVTGMKVPTVKTRLLRARLKMRENMNVYFKRGESSCAAQN